jgi:hypothetical protein
MLLPDDNAVAAADQMIEFKWPRMQNAALYRLDIADQTEQIIFSALMQSMTLSYHAPSWLRERATGEVKWRVVALDKSGVKTIETPWRKLRLLK